MSASELPTTFNSLPCMPEVEWLFELRDSEIFLQQWRTTGEKTADELIKSGDAGGADSAEDVLLTQTQVLEKLIPMIKKQWESLASSLSAEARRWWKPSRDASSASRLDKFGNSDPSEKPELPPQ